MQPDLNQFIKRYEEHQAELAKQLTPEQTFAESQFKSVTSALNDAATAMTKFLKTYQPKTSVTNFPTKIGTPDVTTAMKTLEKSLKPDNSDVVKALKSLQGDIKKLPSAMPDSDQAVVSSLDALTSKLSTELTGVIRAIKAQDLQPKITLPAPKVTVQPTPVTVKETDVKGLIKAMEAVQNQIRTQVFPVSNTPTDPLITYQPADIDDANPIQYFGFTQVGGPWYIRKFDTSVAPKTLRFCFGQYNYASGTGTSYTTAWAARASQTYTIWGT